MSTKTWNQLRTAIETIIAQENAPEIGIEYAIRDLRKAWVEWQHGVLNGDPPAGRHTAVLNGEALNDEVDVTPDPLTSQVVNTP